MNTWKQNINENFIKMTEQTDKRIFIFLSISLQSRPITITFGSFLLFFFFIIFQLSI